MMKLAELKKRIDLCKKHKRELISNVELIDWEHKERYINALEHKIALDSYLQGKSLEDWIKVYDDHIGHYNDKIIWNKSFISGRVCVIGFIFLMLITIGIFLSLLGPTTTGFAVKEINETIYNITFLIIGSL